MNPEEFEKKYASLFERLRNRRGACPDAEQLIAFSEGRMDPAGRPAVEEHLQLCDDCSELVARLAGESPPLDDLAWRRQERKLERRTAPWASRSGRRWKLVDPRWALAAAAVLLVATSVVLWRAVEGPPAAQPPAEAIRGELIRLEEPVGAVDRIEWFRWSTLPIADSFRLQVQQGGTIIWEATTSDGRLRAPESLMLRLEPGTTCRWKVEARDADGGVVAESAWAQFQVR